MGIGDGCVFGRTQDQLSSRRRRPRLCREARFPFVAERLFDNDAFDMRPQDEILRDRHVALKFKEALEATCEAFVQSEDAQQDSDGEKDEDELEPIGSQNESHGNDNNLQVQALSEQSSAPSTLSLHEMGFDPLEAHLIFSSILCKEQDMDDEYQRLYGIARASDYRDKYTLISGGKQKVCVGCDMQEYVGAFSLEDTAAGEEEQESVLCRKCREARQAVEGGARKSHELLPRLEHQYYICVALATAAYLAGHKIT